jgi:uncharacterized protein with HEPN domain
MSKGEWKFYLEDMIGFAENVLLYSRDFDLEGFVKTGLNYDATVRNLELIGEAANHIPAQIQKECPSVPWRQLVATRNRLIHGYLGIDNDILWSIIQNDTPELITELEKLINKLTNS